MEKITEGFMKPHIATTLRIGKSGNIPVEDSQLAYFRWIIAKYNKANNTSISSKKFSNGIMQLHAQVKSYLNDDLLAEINELYSDPKKRITPEKAVMIAEYLKELYNLSQERTIKKDLFSL